VWGAISGVAAAAGVLLGGVLTQGPGWRWVLFVNIPVCVVIVAAAFRLVPGTRPRVRPGTFDLAGAVLITAAMLLLVFALVKAPEAGWGSRQTIGELATAAVLFGAFVIAELRSRNPLFPFAILRVKGLAAADATQLIAFAGFLSVFFFLTLYMQNVLGFTPIQSGSAYLPVTAGIVLAAGACSQLIPRIGTRPIIVTGTLVAAAGMFDLSRIPAHGSYVADLLPGLAPPACSTARLSWAPRSDWPSSPPSPPPAPTSFSTSTWPRPRRSPPGSAGLCWPAPSPCSPRPSSRCARPVPAARHHHPTGDNCPL
jgi:MFS family permease